MSGADQEKAPEDRIFLSESESGVRLDSRYRLWRHQISMRGFYESIPVSNVTLLNKHAGLPCAYSSHRPGGAIGKDPGEEYEN